MRRGRLQPLAVIAVFIAVAAFQLWNRHGVTRENANRGASATAPAPTPERNARDDASAPAGALTRTVTDPDERAQIEKTLASISHGGPFLHRQDGAIFSNREARLPQKPRGYYREYTVETPGADTRGARRIVRGNGGETYYTNDHYGTFIRVE